MKQKYLVGLVAAVLFNSAHASEGMLEVKNLINTNKTPEIHGIVTNERTNINVARKENYYIVRLESSPLGAMAFAKNASFKTSSQAASKTSGNQLKLNSAEAKAHSMLLAQERTAFTQNLQMKIPAAKIGRHYDAVMNAIVVRADKDIFNELQMLSGVSKVFREEMAYANLDASTSLIKATEIWEQMGGKVNAGKGIRVAVIDTGIRPEHPMFSDEGLAAPTNLPTDDYCSQAADFCNNKLIVARSATPTAVVHPDEHLSPLGYASHGTHVAGTAVGSHVSMTYNGVDLEMSGVAPGAYLMAYKGLFTTPAGRGSGSNVMLLEMLDWAVKDGADVINNSWGGGAGSDPAGSVFTEAFQTAEDAGIVVVNSAGNSGPGPQTIGCPSCIESGISVASTFHGRFFGNSLQFESNEPVLAIPSSETTLTVDLMGNLLPAIEVDEANFDGCSAFATDSFVDSIALISRGSCNFTDKVANATKAGATGVVVYNNIVSAPLPMFVSGTTIPSVMISKADGESILASITAEANQVTIDSETKAVIAQESVDVLSGFSSRGPNGNHDSLKPDIAAPGQDILSAYSPDDSGGLEYGTMSGTSMASPHVAGAAAIMQQMYPTWSATDIKTALTSTAKSSGLLKDDYATPADAFDVGAGRVDLATATAAAVTFDKPSMAKNPCIVTCNFTRSMSNKMAAEGVWNATISFDSEDVTGQVSPSTMTLAAMDSEGANGDFTVTVDASHLRDEGWQFGQVTWTDTSGVYPEAHLPIAVAIDGSTMSSSAGGNTVIGSAIPVSTKLINTANTFSEQLVVHVKAPEGMELVEDSERATVVNGTEILLDHDLNANRIGWTGVLNESSFDSTTYGAGAGLPSLVDLGVAAAACSGECDEVAINIDLSSLGLTFEYNSLNYSSLTISDNGFVIPGTGNTAGSWSNQEMPSDSSPNNVIAPFWADFDLTGDANTTGGGTIHIGIFTLSGTPYLAIEWNNAQLYNDSDGKMYTFQVWMSLGDSQDIFYNYVRLDATLPTKLSVGAENSTGTLGLNYHYNGAGNPISAPLAIAVETNPAGSVEVGYELNAVSPLAFGMSDTADADEDGDAVVISPLTNDATSLNKTIDVSFVHAGALFTTPQVINVMVSGAYDVTTVQIVDAAENGETVVNADGTIAYTANADFNGTDTFTYDVADADGTRIEKTLVTVNVAATNDAPTLTAGADATVEEEASVSLSVVGADIDGDSLTYTWTQVAGINVNASSTTQTLAIDAPSVDADETLTFEVVASDGVATSNKVTVKVTVTNKSSGGGSFGWLLLALPLAFGRKLIRR